MRIFSFKYFCYFSFLFFISCNFSGFEDKEFDLFDIHDNLNKSKNISISSISSCVKYIRLETLEKNLIHSRISQIAIIEDIIFILDNSSNLYLFNLQGKFLRKIGNLGKGPGEYINSSRFLISKNSRVIYVLDGQLSKVYKYKFDGTFLEETIPTPLATNIGLFENYIFYYVPSEIAFYDPKLSYNLFVTSEEGELVSKFLKINKSEQRTSPFLTNCQFYYFENDLFFMEPFCDTIFTCTRSKLIPKYVFDFGEYKFPKAIMKDLKQILVKAKNYVNVKNVMESKNYIFFSYLFENEYKIMCIDKNNRDIFNIYAKDGKPGFENDYNGLSPIFPKAILSDSIMVDYIEAFELKRQLDQLWLMDSLAFLENNSLVKLIDNLHDNDNPILVIIYLK